MPVYIVFEIQSYVNGETGTLVNTFTDRSLAESKYHLVLSAAAVSQVPYHSCVLMTNEGFVIESKTYNHVQPTSDQTNEA